jgi:hypothetical protein
MNEQATSPEFLARLAEAREKPDLLRSQVAAKTGLSGAELDAKVAGLASWIDSLLDGSGTMAAHGHTKGADRPAWSGREGIARAESERRLLAFWHEYQAWKAARPKPLDMSGLSAEQRKLWEEHRRRVPEPRPSSGPLTPFPDLDAPLVRALELFATLRSERRGQGPTVHDVAVQMRVSDGAVKGYRRELLIRSEYGSLHGPKPSGLTAKERRARREPFKQKARRMNACAKGFLAAVYAAGERGEDLFDAFARLAGEASARCAYCATPLLDRSTMYGSDSCKVLAARRRTRKLTRPVAKARA